MQGLIIDNFAGGGGASTGIEQGMGRKVDIAINHDEAAIAVHEANHPDTQHFCQSVWDILPGFVVGDREVDLAWFSPDCKHFSKAKGGKPVERRIRDLAWVVVAWARDLPELQKPKVIMLENVEEFQDWGPLVETDKGLMPDPTKKGLEFQRWIAALKKCGYRKIEWRELRACDYGAPTIRKRLFLIARRDGLPIVWPKPTHGDPKSRAVKSGKLAPWPTAAECIDWSIPCPSIFERKKPLKEATCRRIAAGIMRYVVNSPRPFIVPITHTQAGGCGRSADDPLATVTTARGGEFAVVAPSFAPLTHQGSETRSIDPQTPMPTITCANRGEIGLVSAHLTKFRANSIGSGADEPMHTITANSFVKRSGGAAPLGLVSAHLMTMRNSGKPWQGCDEPTHTVTAEGAHQFAVAAFLAQHNGGNVGRDPDEPVSTVTVSGSQQQVVTSHLLKLRGTCADGQPVDEPAPTVTAGGLHVGEVRAFLTKYYGAAEHGQDVSEPMHTATDRARFGLVTVTIGGEPYVIVDIGMRMLEPRELARAQGFPDDYVLSPECWYVTDNGNRKLGPLPKSHQIAKIGNSVCPVMSKALTIANCGMYAARTLESEAA